MKNLLLAFFLVVCVSGYSQIPLGFKAGVNVSEIVMKGVPDDFDEDYSSVASFHVGVSRNWYYQISSISFQSYSI